MFSGHPSKAPRQKLLDSYQGIASAIPQPPQHQSRLQALLAAIAQEIHANVLVDFPSKRDNSRLRQRNAHVTEVSPTRLSGPRQRRRAAKAIHRKAGQERNLRPARTADAGHAYGFSLRAMRRSADVNIRTHRKMSEVRLRTPLLPPVYVFRYLEPLRMHPTHPRTDPAQGRAQSMYVLFHARAGRKGNLYAKFSPPHGRPHRIRESLQKVSVALPQLQ